MALYDELVPPLAHQLRALSAILTKAEADAEARKIDPAVLLGARLYPDMFPLSRQVQIACDQGHRALARLQGAEPVAVPNTEVTFEALRGRIAATVAALEAADGAALEGGMARTIRFPAGDRQIEMSGPDYVRRWILPNFYFHMTTAYAILRHNGLALGKADFLGAGL